MRKKKVLLTLFLVILFLCVYTTIDFFHNHKTLEDLPSCPACHFAHIFMSLLPQVLIFLASLLLIEIVISVSCFSYKNSFIRHFLSRSPPAC
ncbi:MAG TPA: hypothetical protein PLP57_05425 [Candidatus Saccharicenans sp.]|nr:hypothetical protein [Candidatus Saccharicenans sp.]HRD02070.1 hypothetical protein [Candidatus Saccharicenans sp.]